MKKSLFFIIVVAILTAIFLSTVQAQCATGWHTQQGIFVPDTSYIGGSYFDTIIDEEVPILIPIGWHLAEQVTFNPDGSVSYEIAPDPGRWEMDPATGHLFWIGDPGEGWHVEQELPCPDGYHIIWSTLTYGHYGQPSYNIEPSTITTAV